MRRAVSQSGPVLDSSLAHDCLSLTTTSYIHSPPHVAIPHTTSISHSNLSYFSQVTYCAHEPTTFDVKALARSDDVVTHPKLNTPQGLRWAKRIRPPQPTPPAIRTVHHHRHRTCMGCPIATHNRDEASTTTEHTSQKSNN